MRRPEDFTFRQFEIIRQIYLEEHGERLVVEELADEFHTPEIDEISEILGIGFVLKDRWYGDNGESSGADEAIYTVQMRKGGRYAAFKVDDRTSDAYYIDDRGNMSLFCGSLPGKGDTISKKILANLKAGCTIVYDDGDVENRVMMVPSFSTTEELRLKVVICQPNA